MSSHHPPTTNIEKEIFPLEIGYLPEKFRKKAELELNYTTKVREETLRTLKERIADDVVLKGCRIQDDLLLLYLNSRKYDVARTLKQLKKYIAFRKDNIHRFNTINYQTLLPLLEIITPLPWRCPDGCTIFYVDLEYWNFERHAIDPVKQMFLICLTMCQLEPMSQVNGYKVIFTLNVSPDILRLATPSNIYLLYYGSQQVLPVRLKEMHLVHMGVIARTVYQISKIFFSEKLKKRIHMHATSDSLLKCFPKAILPCKVGGELTDYDMTDWLKRHTTPKELSLLKTDYE